MISTHAIKMHYYERVQDCKQVRTKIEVTRGIWTAWSQVQERPRLQLCRVAWETNENRLRGLSARPNYTCRRLSSKLKPTFADRECRVVTATDPYGRNLDFLDRSRYFFFQVAPQLYSWGWVDPVPDPLLLRKCGSAGNRTRTSGSATRDSDH
jgi:hypothetical protein